MLSNIKNNLFNLYIINFNLKNKHEINYKDFKKINIEYYLKLIMNQDLKYEIDYERLINKKKYTKKMISNYFLIPKEKVEEFENEKSILLENLLDDNNSIDIIKLKENIIKSHFSYNVDKHWAKSSKSIYQLKEKINFFVSLSIVGLLFYFVYLSINS
jgi:hypothetical protein